MRHRLSVDHATSVCRFLQLFKYLRLTLQVRALTMIPNNTAIQIFRRVPLGSTMNVINPRQKILAINKCLGSLASDCLKYFGNDITYFILVKIQFHDMFGDQNRS